MRHQSVVRSFRPARPARGPGLRRIAGGLLLPLLLGLLHPGFVPAALGQTTGTVTGRVVGAGSARGLASVQIYLEGTGLGTLSREDGRYLIINVPAGTYRVRAEQIGMKSVTQEVTVAAGQSARVEFALEEEVLGLDEIVVTGTAGAARRREVGNSIAQLNMAQLTETPVNVDALLQGRMAGVTVLPTTGSVGGGSQIRLRGNVSVAMSNQPLVYVDGVRIRSDGYPDNDPVFGQTNRGANYVSSPLNDINPNDIERVEVIKGAAATTLYGTEAAAGVIQIFTKRGQRGAKATWTAQIDQGFDHLLAFGPAEPGPNGEDASHMFMDPWLRNAQRQGYSLSVTGGIESVQYFISGSYRDNDGVLPLDSEKSFTVRGNVTATPLTGLQLQWNTAYTSTHLTQTPTGNNLGLTLNVYRRDRNYVASEKKEDIDQFLVWNLDQWVDHLVTGVTATHNLGSAFTQRFTAGYDLSFFDGRNYRPFGTISFPLGTAQDKRWEGIVFTLDYVGTLNFNLTRELRNSFSFGGQSVTTEENWTAGGGNEWPGPGDHVVSNAAVTLGFEGRQRVVNAGFFVQNLFDFRNRYFLTAGLRVDGNSAFGEDLGLQAYPKLSFSYVLSDEAFWPDALGNVKLRAAWGQAGRAPGAFDAVRTWSAVGWGPQPAFRPNRLGNPELGPERTTETELGFEGAFFQDRLSLEFTYYRQRTTDALFEVTRPPSGGFLNTQLENVGEMENRGVELATNFKVLQQESFAWEVGGSISKNDSKVLTLGGIPEFSLGNQGWIVEGQSAPVIRGRCVLNPDEIAAPKYPGGLDCFYGPNLPNTIFNVLTRLELPWGVSLNARGEYQGGGYMYDGAAFNAIRRNVKWPGCFEVYKKQGAQEYNKADESMLTALERAQCNPSRATTDVLVYPTDFFKLREVTLRVPLPEQWVPGSSSASVTLSARNAWKWVNEDFPVFDPEMANNDGMETKVRSLLEHVPPPATYLLSFKVIF
ncbi:MAG: TonB-dependent receptor [Gemmatimonadetes bacterium]|nr:TonB-dependent receptor [Gemmatimonadota bacterium]